MREEQCHHVICIQVSVQVTDMDIGVLELSVVKVEEETTIDIKEEDISVDGTFPAVKTKEDQSTLNEDQHVHDVDRLFSG